MASESTLCKVFLCQTSILHVVDCLSFLALPCQTLTNANGRSTKNHLESTFSQLKEQEAALWRCDDWIINYQVPYRKHNIALLVTSPSSVGSLGQDHFTPPLAF